jgi:dTDP-4-dehydrorhamnose reductase
MKILVTGAAGMLGRDLVAELAPRHQTVAADLADCDLTNAEATRELLRRAEPDWVINCAAYTKVDQAEAEPDQAFAANVTAVRNLALACKDEYSLLLHLSTDYVFDGALSEPYLPVDEPNPQNVYGRTKLQGEQTVRDIFGEDAAVIRTAWLYGPHSPNFVESILRQIDAARPLSVVNDQIGSPTYTAHLAAALRAAVESDLRGTHHVTNGGCCSWFDFAAAICELIGRRDYPLAPISSAQIDRPARRPANSRLDMFSFEAATGFVMPPWRDGLSAYLQRTGRLA